MVENKKVCLLEATQKDTEKEIRDVMRENLTFLMILSLSGYISGILMTLIFIISIYNNEIIIAILVFFLGIIIVPIALHKNIQNDPGFKSINSHCVFSRLHEKKYREANEVKRSE